MLGTTQYPEDASVCSIAWFQCVTTMPSLRWSRLSLRWRMFDVVGGMPKVHPGRGRCPTQWLMRVRKHHARAEGVRVPYVHLALGPPLAWTEEHLDLVGSNSSLIVIKH